MKKTLYSRSGMSLIEIMVVITIMSFIGIGTATLMRNMTSIQSRATIKANIARFKANLEEILREDQAWMNSINDPVNNVANRLGCLVEVPGVGPGSCNNNPPPTSAQNVGVPSTGINWRILDADGTIFYDPGQSASVGFDTSGNICNSFNPASPDDDCPYRYNIRLYTSCGSRTSPCKKPDVTIHGLLVHAPENPGDPRARLRTSDYDIIVQRSVAFRFEPFEITHTLTDPGPAPAPGGGQCIPPTTVRPLTTLSDTAGNASLAGNQFTLVEGSYECRVMAQSFEAIDGFFITLENVTTGANYPVGGGYSNVNTTAFATGTVNFQVSTVTASFQLVQRCSTTRSQYDMGIPAPTYGAGNAGNTVTTISCVRTL